MSDLGIRFPVTIRQINTNSNIPLGSPGTSIAIPSYIPPGGGMDQFTVDATAGVVTIAYDLNQIIAENISTVSPFHIQ
jgi:hypothetical protein